MSARKIYYKIALLMILASILSLAYFTTRSVERYSFANMLKDYGFDNQEKLNSLEYLLKKSKIIRNDISLQQAFPIRETKNRLLLDIILFLKMAQEKFVIRKGVKERWEVSPLSWMQKDKDKILDALQTLGFVSPIKSKFQHVDAICVLGAAATRMQNRLDYANRLINNGLHTDKIILLSGERALTKGIDGSEEQLNHIAALNGKKNWKYIYEFDLFKYLYANCKLYKKQINTYTINNPKGELPRPTTQTNILRLVQWLKEHPEVNSITFISNQPYVNYQKSNIDIVFRSQKIKIDYEVVGEGVHNLYNLNNLQPIMEGFGSYIWRETPYVLQKNNIKVNDNDNIIDALHRLYAIGPYTQYLAKSVWGK